MFLAVKKKKVGKGGLLLLLLVFLFVTSCLSTPLASRKSIPKVKSKAPSFALQSQDGELVALWQLKKKGPLVLVFFRGIW